MKKIWYFSILLHVLSAIFSIGRYHSDEQYQILEFAAYKTGVNSSNDLPWEFKEKIRSTAQVSFAYLTIKASNFVGVSSPFTQATILRLFSSLLGLLGIYLLLRKFKKINQDLYHKLVYLSLLWAFVPWFHARFSAENICGSLIIIALFLFDSDKNNIKTIVVPNRLWQIFIVAFILALSGLVRLQANFLVFGFFIWIVVFCKPKLSQIIVFVFAIILVNFMGALIDRWFYGTWEITQWNYVYQNIILHKSDYFGKEPFWFFFEQTFLQTIPPFSIALIVAFIFFFVKNPTSTYTWVIGFFLIPHFFISHKEERFLFPLIPFVPIIIVLAYKDLLEGNKFPKTVAFINGNWGRFLKRFFVFINTVLLIYLCLTPADEYTSTLKYLYQNHKEPTIMVCENKGINPYSNSISLKFYRNPNIDVVVGNRNIDSLKKANPTKKLIYVSDIRELNKLGDCKISREYSNHPDWLWRFNFNNWVDRIHHVYIYCVK